MITARNIPADGAGADDEMPAAQPAAKKQRMTDDFFITMIDSMPGKSRRTAGLARRWIVSRIGSDCDHDWSAA
jgi:hypothetical protein